MPLFEKGKKEDPGNYQAVSLISIPGKMMEHLILEAISKHMEDKKVIRSTQYGFSKGKSRFTNLIAFYNETTTWMDDRRAVDIVYLDFSKTFNTVSHDILIDKLRKCRLRGGKMRWTENWLTSKSQRAEISGTRPS
ncbi:RNA-directed DNA polymerase from mobile element jockey-like protein [Willisornis vidua]|uniref:RNA-directed DNA polymerase from mobile element jockey-like protein n=1 Tax=Willisornis vidua TaxID=1566151 RepID=A0ABQ9CVB5_9PASS|nr:RNA-directed DNA polymerase from mobile element jockey-like protein [Willisornis vidua]